MNSQIKAFQFSVGLHGVLAGIFLVLSTQIGPAKKLMMLDFNVSHSKPIEKKVEPLPVLKKEPVKPKAAPAPSNRPLKDLEETVDKPPAADVPPTIKLPEAPGQGAPGLGLGMVPSSKSIKEGSAGMAGGSKEGTGKGSGGGGGEFNKEAAKNRYLKEHFAYIRDKILRQVTYPTQAYRLGWQGKVVLSFIITAVGMVREVTVIQSSGFPVLDKNAVETVNEAAPFPTPPIEAQLFIPIVYRLE